MSKTRNRTAYMRQWNQLRKDYFRIHPGHPDFGLSWDEFRVKYLHAPGHQINSRRTKDRSTMTDRQKYQATYQAGRRAAEAYYNKTPKVRAQYKEFTEYWQAMKHTYLPDGFLTGRKHLTHNKREAGSNTRRDRSDYMVAYRRQRRTWERQIPEFRAQYNDSWETYWNHVKEVGFTLTSPITRPSPVAVLLEGMDNLAANEDNDGWFLAA